MTAIDDLTRLHHIQDAASEALFFMSGKTREDLANDKSIKYFIPSAFICVYLLSSAF